MTLFERLARWWARQQMVHALPMTSLAAHDYFRDGDRLLIAGETWRVWHIDARRLVIYVY